MGGGSWKGSLVVTTNSNVESHLSIEPNILGNEYPSEQNKKAEEIEEAVQIITGQFSLAWQSLKHVSNYCFENSYENRLNIPILLEQTLKIKQNSITFFRFSPHQFFEDY